MRIDIGISTLKDLSGIDNCQKLLTILNSHGLVIEKMGEYEPVKKEFSKQGFEELWGGRTSPANITSCSILFKGHETTKFSGMISWDKNLFPMPMSVNGFNLWLNVKKSYNIDNLISLVDEIFEWSEAEHGYISERNKSPVYIQIQQNGFRVYAGNMYKGLYNLSWINYFGKAYLAEDGFSVPEDAVKLGHGIKLQLTEKPDDERLSDLRFLETYYSAIGNEWFWHFDDIVKDGKNYIAHLKEGFQPNKVRIPKFDRAEITRKEG